MTVPYTFATATTSLPLNQLDSNFNTPITLGNTAIYLGNTTTFIGNLALGNVAISSGNVIVTSVTTTNLSASNVSITGGSISNISNLTVTTITSPAATNLTLQSAGNTAITIDTSQNVGIGTASPTGKTTINYSANSAYNTGLSVYNANTGSSATTSFQLTNDAGNRAGAYLTSSTCAFYGGVNTFNFGTVESIPFIFLTGNTERMRIDSSGNVGIGTSSPLYTTANRGVISLNGSSNALFSLSAGNSTSTSAYFYYSNPDLSITNTTTGGIMNFLTANTERMRIDTSGNLLVGTTSTFVNQKIAAQFDQSTQSGIGLKNTNASNTGYYVSFYNSSGTNQGNILQVSSSVVAYGTTSDYRLKENIKPMTGSLDKIQALKPVTYKWKIDGSEGQGFIAHELQEIVPECVIGEKDATRIEKYEISPAIPAEIDSDGKTIKEAIEAVMGEREVPVYQNIDTSFLVATLTAAIQEQQAMIEELKTKVLALEAK